MDEDFQSFIVNPNLVDEGIDVSGLKTQTSTRPELLFDLPEFSGIKVDPTKDTYIQDMYKAYGSGLPMLPEPVVEDTAQIPGAIDTLVDVGGGGGGMDQVTGGSLLDTTPTITQPAFTQPAGGGADMGTVPPQISGGDSITIKNIGPGREYVQPDGTVINIDPLEEQMLLEELRNEELGTDTFTPTLKKEEVGSTTSIDKLPMVQTSVDAQGNIYSMRSQDYGAYLGNINDDVALTGQQEQQEGFIQNVLGRAGQTVEGALNELGKVPGAVADFTNQTIDIFGRKLNVGKTLALAAINKAVGAPVSLVFDALGAILPQESLENQTKRSIVNELKSEKNYGFNIQSGNLNQDPFGRNPVSAFGDYEQTLTEDINDPSDTRMGKAKKEFAQDYFNKKAEKAGGVEITTGKIKEAGGTGVVGTGVVLAPGEAPGDLGDFTTGDVNIVDEVALTGDGGGQDKGPSAPAKTSQGVTTSQFQAFRDTGGAPVTGTTKPGTGGGGGGGQDKGGCVIATHAVNSGAFTKATKREAVRWCVKNLHRTWWGEAIRRGYRYYGQKAIEEGNAKNHYQEFKDYVAFGTGKRRTLKTGWTFVYRTVQFFLKGLTL